MKYSRRQSGFALLMVLALVLIAGATLAGIAQRSAGEAIESVAAREELQRRWAVISCRGTLLPRAQWLLEQAERGATTGDPRRKADQPTLRVGVVAERRVAIRLAETDYVIVVADEQAKVNVNECLRQFRRADVQQLVGRLVRLADSAGEGRATRVNLRPLTMAQPTGQSAPRIPLIGGYGQIFDDASPAQLWGSAPGEGLAANITCWGDGKLNLHRASPAALREACKPLGGDVAAALLEVRSRVPHGELSDLLPKLSGIDEKRRGKLRDYVTDQSNCHSVWIIAHGRHRTWHTLAVGLSVAPASSSDGVANATRSISQRFDYSW